MAASIRGTAVTAAIAVVASLGLLLPGTPTVAAGAEQGRLSVAPDHGPAGSHAQVVGAGFADDRAVEIRWEPTGERLGTVTGPEFSTTVSIPGDATEGSHAIGARGQPREAEADARHATTPFTVTAADDPNDVVAGEDDDADSAAEGEAGADQPADDDGDDDDESDESDEPGGSDGDGDAVEGEEDPSGGSDGSQAGDDGSEPSEEPQSTEDADAGSGGADGASGDGDGESGSDTSGDGAPQRTSMSPNPDDDAPAESDGQESDAQETDAQEADGHDVGAQEPDGQESGGQEADSDGRDPEADPQENESSGPTEASSGKAETATAAPRESDDDGAASTDEDRSSATTYRKSSSGPPAAVSHEVGEVQSSAVEEPPDVDFAAVFDSEAFQAQDAPAPEVAADGPAQPDAAARERLATAGGSRSRQVPAATEPSTPQGTPAAVGTQAAAPNSEEVSLLVLLAATGALLVWHRRRQPLLGRR